MKDIATREDIIELVRSFYDQVLKDELIGFYFTEIAQLDLEAHLPVMFDFWESNLLGTATYTGNPMTPHIQLNRKSPMKPAHFERWLNLWAATVNQFFKGPKADEAIKRASNIAALMKFKICNSQ